MIPLVQRKMILFSCILLEVICLKGLHCIGLVALHTTGQKQFYERRLNLDKPLEGEKKAKFLSVFIKFDCCSCSQLLYFKNSLIQCLVG